MAFLLSAYFVGSASILVWRTLREVERAEARLAVAAVG
jgi:hypothetical protein